MKYLALALFLITGTASFAHAQTVKGGGSVKLRAVKICRWNTDPACQVQLVVANTSDKIGVTKVELTGIDPIITWIAPLGEGSFFVADAKLFPDTAALNKLIADSVIFTAKKPKPDKSND